MLVKRGTQNRIRRELYSTGKQNPKQLLSAKYKDSCRQQPFVCSVLLNTQTMPPPDHRTYRHAHGVQRPQFQCFFLLNNTYVELVMLEAKLPKEEDEGWLEKGACRGNNSQTMRVF